MLDSLVKNVEMVDPTVRELYFHADSCSSENKNRYVLGYFSHLVATGMFMLQGHTQFAPDGAFRLIKRYYRKHVGIYTLPEVADAVDKSSRRNGPILAETVTTRICHSLVSISP
jgi:hypothetical protein